MFAVNSCTHAPIDTDAERCSAALPRGLILKPVSRIKGSTPCFCLHFCGKAGKGGKNPSFDVNRVFIYILYTFVSYHRGPVLEDRALDPFGQRIQEEAIRVASLES